MTIVIISPDTNDSKINTMSTADLNGIKLNLISWINQLSDVDLITFLDGMRMSRSKNDWWAELSVDKKKHVLAGLKDAENNKLMDSKSFWESLSNA